MHRVRVATAGDHRAGETSPLPHPVAHTLVMMIDVADPVRAGFSERGCQDGRREHGRRQDPCEGFHTSSW
jgi:hypothetical protein